MERDVLRWRGFTDRNRNGPSRQRAPAGSGRMRVALETRLENRAGMAAQAQEGAAVRADVDIVGLSSGRAVPEPGRYVGAPSGARQGLQSSRNNLIVVGVRAVSFWTEPEATVLRRGPPQRAAWPRMSAGMNLMRVKNRLRTRRDASTS